LAFFESEYFGSVGKVEENEFCDYGDADGGYAFDYEEPAPAFNSMGIMETTCDSPCEKTAEGS
jgi:hypothetical protein